MYPLPLIRKRNWITWKYEWINDRKTKIPYNPITGRKARSIDNRTWVTYQSARKAIGYDGIGFVFDNDGIFGIDIDHCMDEETNTIKKQVMDFIEYMNSYTEISPSGKGIHIIGFYNGTNKKSQRTKDIEIYFTGRYFTMSGRPLKDLPIADLTEKIDRFREKIEKENQYKQPIITKKYNTENISLSDKELLEKIFNWKNGALLKQMYEGQNPIKDGNISSNDFYFVKSLNFANNNDIIQTDRIFRNSGRMRPKWDEVHYATGETYGQHMLQITQI